jgi:predicted dehydrogenase
MLLPARGILMLRVGMVGCGDISETYLANAPLFRDFAITAVSARRPEPARRLAEKYRIRACSIDEMMASVEIDAILNLTVPAAHVEISLRAIETGKHVFSEKPLATSLADALAVNTAAAAKGLRVGVAPDTVFGPGMQTACRMIDEGRIGRPISGISAMMNRGMEMRHPNPDFFFKPGGGPVLDVAPYYLSMMVLLLGSVRSVTAIGTVGFAERIVGSPGNPRLGEAIRVEVLTTVQGVLRFDTGAQVAFSYSWDVCSHGIPPLEVYGSEGSMRLPDPNFFGGTIGISRERGIWEAVEVEDQPFGRPNFPASQPVLANYRGLGLADMASAIARGRPHRADGEFGLHILDTLLSIETAAREGKNVAVASRIARRALLSGDDARRLLSGASAPELRG